MYIIKSKRYKSGTQIIRGNGPLPIKLSRITLLFYKQVSVVFISHLVPSPSVRGARPKKHHYRLQNNQNIRLSSVQTIKTCKQREQKTMSQNEVKVVCSAWETTNFIFNIHVILQKVPFLL